MLKGGGNGRGLDLCDGFHNVSFGTEVLTGWITDGCIYGMIDDTNSIQTNAIKSAPKD